MTASTDDVLLSGNEEFIETEPFMTDWPIPEEVGRTSSSEEEDNDDTSVRRKRPRLSKPWSNLLFPSSRIEHSPSILRGMSTQKELEFRWYLADTILILVQKLGLSLDTYSVAVMFMHRFLMYRPVQVVDKRKLCLACVFLASKTNEDRRPPITNFVCTFYRLCNRRELNPSTDKNVYQRIYQLLLFWESEILLVLGFNIGYNIREIRRDIDTFCEEKIHIPRDILRTALCVFVLNSLALTTLPVRYSYRVIYLIGISLTMAWAGLKEPLETNRGVKWWQVICNSLSVEEFEAMKAETLRVFENNDTKFQEYFSRMSQYAANDTSSGGNKATSSKAGARSHGRSAAHDGHLGNGDGEGLTGLPLIPAGLHNGAANDNYPTSSSSNSHIQRQPHSQSQHHRAANGSAANDPREPHHSHSHTLEASHGGRVRGDHASGPSGSSSSAAAADHGRYHSHKHHGHHHRERSGDPAGGPNNAAEHRSPRKERRSGGEKQHRRRSRSSHRRDSNEGSRETSQNLEESAQEATTTRYPWVQQRPQHESRKSMNKRAHFLGNNKDDF